MTQQLPTVGRIVHYVLDDGTVRPGLVIDFSTEGLVDLQVFTNGPKDYARVRKGERAPGVPAQTPLVVWREDVAQDEAGKAGTWHWPPRAS